MAKMLKTWPLFALAYVSFCFRVVYSASNAQCTAANNRIKAMRTGMAKEKPGYWTRLNENPVCVHPKYETPGSFKSPYDAFIGAIKLVHIFGKVTCSKVYHHYENHWGCNRDLIKPLGIFITDLHKRVIFNRTGSDPPGNVQIPWYSSSLFDGSSSELVFNRMDDPLYVNQDSQLFAWYGEDLVNKDETDNDGQTCVDVYAHFV